MFTTGSKWFFGLGAVALVLAAAYGWSTGGDRLGPVTAGYWGAVGDHLGYTLLVSTGIAATLPPPCRKLCRFFSWSARR